jgi:hypothetical protein
MEEKSCGDTAGGESKEQELSPKPGWFWGKLGKKRSKAHFFQVKLRQLSKNGSFWKASGSEQGGGGKAG